VQTERAQRGCKASRQQAQRHPQPQEQPHEQPHQQPQEQQEEQKLALRAKNLQTVQDDPTLNETLKMSPGTSASVSD